jgi:hypothetical protein
MSVIVLYALIAVFLLIASFWLLRKGAQNAVDAEPEEGLTPLEQLEGAALKLAERIFDPSDYDWLNKELCFPEAAVILSRHRKSLAVQWLKTFRNSFKEFVRVPNPAEGSSSSAGPSGWELLWLTLRFHFLINYALLMVRTFGPYHRIVPILGPLQSLRNLGSAKARLGHAAVERIR